MDASGDETGRTHAGSIESPVDSLLEKVGTLVKGSAHDRSVELDAPAWAIRGDSGRDGAAFRWAGWWLAAVTALLIGLAIVFLVALESSHYSATVDNALAISLAAVLALAVLVGRFALAKRTPESVLRLRVDKAGGTADPGKAANAAGVTAETAASADSPEAADQGSLSGLTAFLAKEPVLVQAAVLVAGILAVGFATNLPGDAVSGIAAGAAAALGLLTRTATTPVAEPKSASGKKLAPVRSSK